MLPHPTYISDRNEGRSNTRNLKWTHGGNERLVNTPWRILFNQYINVHYQWRVGSSLCRENEGVYHWLLTGIL